MASKPLNLPPLRALHAFFVVATEGRLASAAERLGVTESAVSHQLRQLEELLGQPLFDRASGRLVLTPAGERYLDDIGPALLAIHQATEAARPTPGHEVVRVTLPPSLAATWLIPRLDALAALHPNIELEFVATTRVVDLAREQVDLAVRYGRGAWPRVEAQFLFAEQAMPVCAPNHLRSGLSEADALAASRLIVNRSTPNEWEEWAKARGLTLPGDKHFVTLDVIEQALQVAEGGHGIAMGRAPYIEERLQRGTLVAPFGRGEDLGTGYYLCRPLSVEPTAAVRKVMRWLGEQGRASSPVRQGEDAEKELKSG